MWIRNQGKTTLLKAEIVEYCYQHHIYVNGIKFAEYSSEEKALKVLDLIAKHINKENTYDVLDTENISKPYKIEKSYNIVFQMPQDNEVE